MILSRGERLHLDLALSSAGLPEVDGVEAAESVATGKSFMTAEELEALERSNLVAALGEAGWKVSGKGGAAELLGMKPSTLRYQMKSLGIENPGR